MKYLILSYCHIYGPSKFHDALLLFLSQLFFFVMKFIFLHLMQLNIFSYATVMVSYWNESVVVCLISVLILGDFKRLKF